MLRFKFIKGSYEKIHRVHEDLDLGLKEYALVKDYKNSFITNLYVGVYKHYKTDKILLEDMKHYDDFELTNEFICSFDTNNALKLSLKELKNIIKNKLK